MQKEDILIRTILPPISFCWTSPLRIRYFSNLCSDFLRNLALKHIFGLNPGASEELVV
jgi:hypothetical protein